MGPKGTLKVKLARVWRWERERKTPSFKNHLAGTVCWTFDSLVLRRESASLSSFFYFTYFFVLLLFALLVPCFPGSINTPVIFFVRRWYTSLPSSSNAEEAQPIYIYIPCWKRRIPRRRLRSEGTFDEKWRWVDLHLPSLIHLYHASSSCYV